jgi:hypothetical protein
MSNYSGSFAAEELGGLTEFSSTFLVLLNLNLHIKTCGIFCDANIVTKYFLWRIERHPVFMIKLLAD